MLALAAVQAAPAPIAENTVVEKRGLTGATADIVNGLLAPLLPIIATEAGGVVEVLDTAGNVVGGVTVVLAENL
ncbi:hypothetical protein JCM8202v2_005117 [Rhodotorula sphaerocarpa]